VGYIKAVNQGLKISDSAYICMMNNDTIPAPGWLEHMVEFAEAHADVGLINPQCGGHNGDSVENHARMLESYKGDYMEMNQCQGFCMLVKRDLVNKIGLLDETFGVGGYDDTDYSMRAHKAGFRSVAIRDSYVFHRIHASFDEAGNREEVVKRNRKIYYDKWGKHLRIGVLFSVERLDPFGGARAPTFSPGTKGAAQGQSLDALEMSRLLEYVYGLAREWSWVHIWINSRQGKDVIKRVIDDVMRAKGLMPHQNIRIDCFNMPVLLFDLTVSGKMIERMRSRMMDKRFDALISFDDNSYKLANATAKLLGLSVIRPLSEKEGIHDWLAEGRRAAVAIKEARDGRR
jgi:hypothetical protein